ncbi:MAG TPA: T9SS type A sorting domain-containing protein [Bacteroidia bacterium]|nr:T9SS type A sorting domain-containing protein [Bacteroidota bacterium]MBP9790241.1 T9SS type A sorting domain-containing protein [Bacteroidia bacterium]HQW00261.1 T9SS type A sorting domain-containing protein [Bacteroidia bacterium]
MKLIYTITFLLIALTASSQTYSGPESAEFDVANNRWLIANTSSHQVLARDSAGTLSIFVSGLGSGPYGIEIVGDTLFCCSGASIKGYSLTTATQVFNLNVGASFLNGITHDDAGNLYATDFSAKTIYKVNIAAQTDSIIASGLVQSPNGIIFDQANNRCVFVNWGSNAPIKAINLSTYAVTTIIATTLGSCDGVARDGQGRYYVSNWGAQSIVRFDSSFAAPPTTVATSMSSPADIFYDVTHDILAVPNSGNNTVAFLDFNTTGVTENNSDFMSVAYPNPTSSFLTIDVAGEKIETVSIYNFVGQLIRENSSRQFEKEISIDVSDLDSGNYFYSITITGGKRIVGRFQVAK